MKKCNQWIKGIICSIGIILSGYAGADQSQATGDAPGSDYLGVPIHRIANPAAQTAAIEIQQKLAKVQDYQCVTDSATTETVLQNVVVDVSRGQEIFKRPDCMRYEMTTQRSSHGFLMLYDGKTEWQRNFDAVTQKATAATKKRDYERLKTISLVPPSARLMRPFQGMLAEKITLLREDQDVWIFSDGQTEKTVGKKDGLLRASHRKEKGQLERYEKYSDVKINTGLATDAFVFTPLPEEVIKDDTDDMIKRITAGRSNNEKR